MSVIRNDGPRPTHVPTARPSATHSAEATKKATVQIAAKDSVGNNAIAEATGQLKAQELTQTFSTATVGRQDLAARFDALAARFLSVAPPAGPTANKLDIGAAGGASFEFANTLQQLDSLAGTLSAAHKEVLGDIKQAVTVAGSKVLLKQMESTANSAALPASAPTKAAIAQAAAAVSAMVSLPRAMKSSQASIGGDTPALRSAVDDLMANAAGASVEELVMLVMMEAGRDAAEDVRSMLSDIKANNERKKALRAQLAAGREAQAALDQTVSGGQGVVAEAERNAKAAEDAAAEAEKAAVQAEAAYNALAGSGAPTGTLEEAKAKAEQARQAAEAADQAKTQATAALAAANQAKTAIDGLARAMPTPLTDPVADPMRVGLVFSRPLESLGPCGLDTRFNSFSTLCDLFPDPKPASITAALTRIGISGPTASVGDALTKMTRLAAWLTSSHPTSPLLKEVQLQVAALTMASTSGVPVDMCIGFTRAGPTDPEVKAAMDMAMQKPMTSQHLAQACRMLADHCESARSTNVNASIEWIDTNDAVLQQTLRFSFRSIPKVAVATVNAQPNTEEAMQAEFGIGNAEKQAFIEMFAQLPEAARGGKTTWWEWAKANQAQIGIQPLRSSSDFGYANANATAIKVGFQRAAINAATAAGLAVSSADAAKSAAAAAQKEVAASVPLIEAKQSRDAARAAANAAKSAAIQAKNNLDQARSVATKKEGTAAANKAELDKLKDQMDTLGDVSSEMQLKMQMYTDRMQKAQQLLSNLMASFAKTRDQVIGNMK